MESLWHRDAAASPGRPLAGNLHTDAAVIGGGIGGMECALVLKKRGHTPVIFEKSGELGGLYITAAAMSFKEADKALLRWYERELKKNNIEVRFHMEINAPATLRREFDEVIVCTGSAPKTLPVKGFNKTINFTQLLLNQVDAGDRIVFFGGGQSSCEAAYDLIIVDSTDPFGPSEGLFTREFYGSCFNALKEDGILVNQQGSPFYQQDADAMQRSHKRIASTFPISKVYQAHIPTYAAGYWLFGFASKKYHPINDLDAEGWTALNLRTRYYTTRLHVGAFYLPAFLEEMLREVE